jgi:DNA-binding response OmpR family regulator
MYRRPYHVLVLDDDALALYQMMALLKQRDYIVAGAPTVEQARWWLAQWPIDMLISAVRIGGLGGLQVLGAARAQHPVLAGILVGSESDRVIETDAWRLGAPLVIRPYDPLRVLALVAEMLASIRQRQRWPRKPVQPGVPFRIEGSPAKLLDVSYGGLRFALEGEIYDLPSPMRVEFPSAQISVRADLVWSARAQDGVQCVCGAAVTDESPGADWRRFIDSVPAA